MNILQLIQKPQLRGAEIFASQLSNNLTALGHKVQLIALQEGNASLPFTGKLIHLKRPASKRLIDFAGWKMLAREISHFKPDIVQANAGDTLKYAVLSKLLFRWRAPICFRNASTISLYLKKPWARSWNAFLFKHVSLVISVSGKSRQDFTVMFPFLKDHITVIGVGIDQRPLQTKPVPAVPFLLHVGGFTFEKNHSRLLHIFKRVLQSHPGLELWLAGDGTLRTDIEEKAMSMDLSRHIRFLGYQPNVLALMQDAKALVMPSIIEGLPAVILEAMYGHTPVIAYDVGGISEVVKQGETGWLVKAGDEEGFAMAIEEVLRSTKLEEIKNKAYELVVREYDNQVIAKRFLEVYHKAISI